MLGHDRRALTCPTDPGRACPRADCPGRSDPGVCRQLAALAALRSTPPGPAAVEGPGPDLVRLAMAADLCPWGSGPCGCGDGPPRDCARPGRPPKTRRPGCLACVLADLTGP